MSKQRRWECKLNDGKITLGRSPRDTLMLSGEQQKERNRRWALLVSGSTMCPRISLPVSGSSKVIPTDHKASSVEIDGQLAGVTEWVWLIILMYSVQQMLSQVGGQPEAEQVQPVPTNPGSLLCRWSGWEASLLGNSDLG